MDTLSESLAVFRGLADYYERVGQASMRDRFLMLAADAALALNKPDEAEQLRQRLLSGSRHHMLRPYGSFAEAARAADVQTYLADLKANYPLAQARDLLDTLRAGEVPPTEAPRTIPPTAPLLDLNASAPKPAQRLGYPLQIDVAPQRPERPRAQPVPASAPQPKPAASAPQPTREIPLPAPVPKAPREPLPPPSPRSAAAARATPKATADPTPTATKPSSRPVPRVRPTQKQSGGWFSVSLSLLIATAALVLAVFALARPFLPAEWLR